MTLLALDTIAERYVKLVLEVGLYDPDLVDAYFGPPDWADRHFKATLGAARLAIPPRRDLSSRFEYAPGSSSCQRERHAERAGDTPQCQSP